MDRVSLSGYKSYVKKGPESRGVSTLVSNKHTFIEHDLNMGSCKIEYLFGEVIRSGELWNSVFILNVYSSPRGGQRRFTSLLVKAVSMAGKARAPIVVAGDFNAQHQAWGYPHTTRKDENFWQTAADLGLTLITDSNFPTRIGNSVSQDSTPDLTFVGSAGEFSWANLVVELGSDHYIASTGLQVGRKPPRAFNYIDWDHFRKIREERGGDSPENFQEWLDRVKRDVGEVTKSIHTELEVDKMDSRLAHLIEAKESILARWKTQKLNRRLRKRLAELDKKKLWHTVKCLRDSNGMRFVTWWMGRCD